MTDASRDTADFMTEAIEEHASVADATEVHARLARLEREMRELRAALKSSERKAAAPPDSTSVVPSAEIAELRTELAARERQLTELDATAREKVTALSEALAAIEQSAIWRASWPLRRAGAALPQPVRSGLLQVARGAYWAATPHRMPARLNWLRYAPRMEETNKRLEWLNDEALRRFGPPQRRAYGPTEIEQLDIYPTARAGAPIFIFIHSGTWRLGAARDGAFAAEMFQNAGAHYVALDFAGIREAGGEVRIMAEQVRAGIAWVYRNADSFGGDRERIYVGGHSSGAHLSAVAMVSDWQAEFDLPPDTLKGGLLMSGVYDVSQIRSSKATAYVRLTDESARAMSPHLHLERLRAPVAVTYSSGETQEYQRQGRQFFDTVKQAGKPAELVVAAHYGHMEMVETFGNPYAPNGRAALALMELSPMPPGG